MWCLIAEVTFNSCSVLNVVGGLRLVYSSSVLALHPPVTNKRCLICYWKRLSIGERQARSAPLPESLLLLSFVWNVLWLSLATFISTLTASLVMFALSTVSH